LERKTTPEELSRLLLVRLENYRAILETCADADRWYFVARVDDVLAELAKLNPMPEVDDVADPSAA